MKDFFLFLASLHAGNLLPESCLLGAILLTLTVDLLVSQSSKQWLPIIPLVGLIGAFVCLSFQWTGSIYAPSPSIAFGGSIQADPLSIVFRGLLVLASGLSILLSLEYVEKSGTALSEFLVLLLTATLGGMLLAGTNDLIMMFVALETLGLASYLLAGYMKRDARSNEAALKYLLVGAGSSSLFLYGVSWIYGLSGGHLEINYIASSLVALDISDTWACKIALLLMTVGVGFKLSVAPFHQWTPDVYQGSPTPVVAFLSVGSKAAGLVLAIRIVTTLFPSISTEWHQLFEILALLSMVIGNLVALPQTSLKRMLGYSSVGQAGFLLIGLLTGHEAGYSSLLVYMLIYTFMNLGAFACVILFGLRTGSDQIQDYAGLLYKDPFLAICLSICLLSLGGIPPFAGFFGKLYLFWAGWQSGLYTLVTVGLITSVISIYYYLGVIKIMLVKSSEEMSLSVLQYPPRGWAQQILQPLEVGILVCVISTVLAGIAGDSLFELARLSTSQTPTLI
uniref:NAD(P)H-quinone oxidoreductase subunit 2, chloroplastic n=1 Tax=Nephroselmis astigmatica TaxID=259378 RepID=A0A088CJA7_9CHLO|nr:subunit 2 of NADH-plastoquinone oxidoreductase [Nephroselmis astigmatica]AID67676.1 subunit 2 of NADH-plastoquinone oxidoreductase [Nephroselmis astigmatica]